jgi:hypothetical protein
LHHFFHFKIQDIDNSTKLKPHILLKMSLSKIGTVQNSLDTTDSHHLAFSGHKRHAPESTPYTVVFGHAPLGAIGMQLQYLCPHSIDKSIRKGNSLLHTWNPSRTCPTHATHLRRCLARSPALACSNGKSLPGACSLAPTAGVTDRAPVRDLLSV